MTQKKTYLSWLLGLICAFSLMIVFLITSVEAVAYWTPHYYENEYTGEIITGLMEEISSFKSEYNQQGLDCISVRDMYSVQTQHTNGETDSYTIREMNGWVGLSDDTVLVLCCGGTDESGISDDYFEKIEELIDSVDRSGEPLDCYDSWGELVDPSLYDAKTA